jgi:uncharacterized protein (DUF1810 family)
VNIVNSDPYDLERFVTAQEQVFEQVCAELREGKKYGHWMWFIFPQLQGLGRSSTAWRFGISSLSEAEAYLRHSILGPRLQECTRLVNLIEGRSSVDIFGYVDSLKFCSSMTLFAQLTIENQLFKDALEKYFDGKEDPLTLEKLA